MTTEEQIRRIADELYPNRKEEYLIGSINAAKYEAYISGASSQIPKIKELEEELRKFHIEIYHAAKGYSEMTSILNGQLDDATALNKVEDIIAETYKKIRQSKSEISKLQEQNRVMREALERVSNHIGESERSFPKITVSMFKHIASGALAKLNEQS